MQHKASFRGFMWYEPPSSFRPVTARGRWPPISLTARERNAGVRLAFRTPPEQPNPLVSANCVTGGETSDNKYAFRPSYWGIFRAPSTRIYINGPFIPRPMAPDAITPAA